METDHQTRNDIISGENSMTLATLQQMSVAGLAKVAKDLNIQAVSDMRKPELIIQILRTWTVKSGPVCAEGVLEKLPEGYGFLRA